ncbi:MAG: peptidoglycan editing factor PgeF [Bacteroidales bacterium]|nr:peptidoglycan editing factor PgeF [Bacteroidales bacterium]
MKLIKSFETDFFKFNNFSEFENLNHFISTNIRKEAGQIFNDFNISLESRHNYERIISGRKSLSKSVNISLENFVMQNQVHGNNIKIIEEKHRGKGAYNHSDAIQNNDAMLTNIPGICLFLFAADCVPILFYDRKNKVIGAAHAGWQGTVKKIARKTVLKMQEEYNSSVNDIIIGIGPSISVKNYEIGENVLNEGEKAFGTIENYFQFNKNTGKYHFDLWYANKQQLIEVGIKSENIEISELCTFDNPDIFFSARKKDTGRFGAGIMLF